MEALNTLTEPARAEKNGNCCAKCKSKANHHSCKRLKEKAIENILKSEHTPELNNWEPDSLAAYLYGKHHQYYFTNEPVLSGLLRDITDHSADADHKLQRVAGLFKKLKINLEAHFLVEENVVFPHIKKLVAAKRNPASPIPLPVTTVAAPINVMTEEHEAIEDILEELSIVTNNYTPPGDAPVNLLKLYKCLGAFHLNIEQCIYITNNILYPKAMLLERDLITRGVS